MKVRYKKANNKNITYYIGCVSALIKTIFLKENEKTYQAVTKEKRKIHIKKETEYTVQTLTK